MPFDYKVFPAQSVYEYFEVPLYQGAYRSKSLLDDEIKAALDAGYRWVRTEGEHAIFEKIMEPK
jgi:hypothetical protein